MKLVLLIFLWVIGIFIIITLVGSVIAYFTLAVPAMKNGKPLTEEELEICNKLISRKKAYPFMCKKVVKNGKCPCLPCKKLDSMKNSK